MAHRIISVEEGGIAQELGICPGDLLVKINGEDVLDQVDYQYLTACADIDLEVERNGKTLSFSFSKYEEEPLGLTLDSTLMSRPRLCANKCVFCFVDQMTPGCRESLYVKDDDWRLSLMMGNYITMTNLSDKDFDRIIARKASPLYLSVHTTNPELRVKMMGSPRAEKIMENLKRLSDGGISFHCQVVLCPGYNDGAELDRTLEDLSSFYPMARSVALVPVGLTGRRENLTPLTPFNKESAAALIAQAKKWQEQFRARFDTAFVFPADEFYCLSGLPLPEDEEYENYSQLENGVGLLKTFEMEFSIAYRLSEPVAPKKKLVIATGVSFAPFLKELLKKYPIKNLDVRVVAVENHFFGGHVTVTGLLTGSDLIQGLKGIQADEILISQAMLRHEGEMFLDDLTRADVERELGIPVTAVPCDGSDFFDVLCGLSE